MDEQPGDTAEVGSEPKEEKSRGDLVASYGLKVHLRKQEGENLVPVTITDFETAVDQMFTALGYGVTVEAERIDSVVNNRTLVGVDLTQHPLADGNQHGVYSRTPPIMCIRADQGGKLTTPDGVKTFHAGDWICTNIPPQYAWVIDSQTFAVSNFTQIGTLDDAGAIVFPIAMSENEVESTMYTGVATAEGSSADAGPFTAVENVTGPTEGQGSSSPKDNAMAEAKATAEAADTLRSTSMIGAPTGPTKATLPQQSPQKAVSKPPAPKRPK